MIPLRSEDVAVPVNHHAKPLVAMRDILVDLYQTPMLVPSVEAARRSFGDLLKDTKRYESEHPEHFELYLLGHFNEVSGELISLERPRQIAVGADFGIARS